jgi:hypothetical protein
MRKTKIKNKKITQTLNSDKEVKKLNFLYIATGNENGSVGHQTIWHIFM